MTSRIHVASAEECEAADFVVSVRIADVTPIAQLPLHLQAWAQLVQARSIHEPCCDCGELVMVDTLSPRTPRRICLPCVQLRFAAPGAVQ